MGRFSELRGDGEVSIVPPDGSAPMTASLEEVRAADPDHSRHEWGPFAPVPLASQVRVWAWIIGAASRTEREIR